MTLREKILNKVLDTVFSRLEKYIPRIVVVRKGFEENVLLEGFHTIRFHSFLSQPIILGDSGPENKKKVDITSKRLNNECRRLVAVDIAEYINDMEEQKPVKKKRKEGGKQ